MERKASGLAVLTAVAAMLCLVFTGQAFALSDDSVMSQHVLEADGTSGQNTNSGSGIKTGHIQDGAVTTPKIVNGAVTDDKISGTISGSKLGSHTHNGSDVTSGTIGVDKLATYSGVRIVHKGSVDGVNTFNTISAALSSITDNSASNRYVVKVMPGIYNGTVTMKSYVDIVGSGQENTTVTEYVDWGVSNAALENLRVLGEVDFSGTSGVIRDVTVEMLNSHWSGIWIGTNSSLEIHDSKILLADGTKNGSVGLDSNYSSTLNVSGTTIDMTNQPDYYSCGTLYFSGTMVNSTIKMNGGESNYGMCFTRDATIANSRIIVACDTDGGCYGIYGRYDFKVQNSEISATAATTTYNDAGGVHFDSGGGNGTIENSTVSSSQDGLSISGGSVVIDNSKISGASTGINKTGGSFRAGASQISGGHNGSSGTDKVVNCHDGSYNPISDL